MQLELNIFVFCRVTKTAGIANELEVTPYKFKKQQFYNRFVMAV